MLQTHYPTSSDISHDAYLFINSSLHTFPQTCGSQLAFLASRVCMWGGMSSVSSTTAIHSSRGMRFFAGYVIVYIMVCGSGCVGVGWGGRGVRIITFHISHFTFRISHFAFRTPKTLYALAHYTLTHTRTHNKNEQHSKRPIYVPTHHTQHSYWPIY